MIRFILKGIIRDRSRSLLPFLTVTAGVMLTVVTYCWVQGTKDDLIRANANFGAGHVKVMSRAYAREADQIPNDLAFTGVAALMDELRSRYPDLIWLPRIRFGGLLDIPDSLGETKSQSPVIGMAVNMIDPESPEREILNLEKALVSGRLPSEPGEILISDTLAHRLMVKPGETATLISSTMYGAMTTANFIVSGTIRFGISAMDRGAIIADLKDIQYFLDMHDTAGEILGLYTDEIYREQDAALIATDFNRIHNQPEDDFSPVMQTLRDHAGLGQTLDLTAYVSTALVLIFIFVMSIVLWNAGLMASLRRYGEMGIRLAIGEEKGHVYRSLVLESAMIGAFGSLAGTVLGLLIAFYLQTVGIDISSMMKNASMMLSDVLRAKITPAGYYIGFVPGLAATILGTPLSVLGIYRRQTSQLAKEFEG